MNVATIASVVSVPVAVSVWDVVHAAELIAPVAKAFAPLATVLVMVAETLGNVIVVPSVPASVKLLLTVSVFAEAIAAVPAESSTLPLPLEATKLITDGSDVPVFRRKPVTGAAGNVI